MTISKTLAAALATMAIATPAAVAQPADMHASTAQAAAQARQGQDLRSPDAIDAATHPRKAQAVNAPGATAVDSQSTTRPVAPPPATAKSDDGVDWTTIGLGIAGTLLVLGGIVAVTNRTRPTPRTRVSV
jgi:hypothetical protein